MRLARGDAAQHGRVAQFLVSAIVPSVTCLLVLGTLFFLEPIATLLMLVLTGISLLLLYQAINIIVVVPAITLATMYPEYAWLLAGLTALSLTAGWYAASLRLEVRK